MGYECPECAKNRLRCYAGQNMSDTSRQRKYYCEECDLTFQSFETLDMEGTPKRDYAYSGKYRRKEAVT